MDLNVIVMQELKKIEESGFVQETVNSKLKQTIVNVVDDVFGQWSDFSKNIKQHVKENLNIDLKRVDMAAYNQLVLNTVKEHLDSVTHEMGVEKMKAALDEVLASPQPEMKLSELIEKFKSEVRKDGDAESEESITFEIDFKYQYTKYVYFDPEEGKSQYSCKYRLAIDEETGKLNSVKIADKEFNTKQIMGGLYGFEKILFRLYAHGTKIILDADEVNCYYESDDDY